MKVSTLATNLTDQCDCVYLAQNSINTRTALKQWEYEQCTCYYASPSSNGYATTGNNRLAAAQLIIENASRASYNSGCNNGMMTSGWVTKNEGGIATACMLSSLYCKNV